MAIAQVELALVGSLMIAPDRMVKIADVVRVTDFVDSRCQLAFGTILAEWQGKRPVDLVSIAAKNPQLTEFLASATSAAFTPSILSYAEEIAAAARMRRIKTGIEAAAMSEKADEILAGIMAVYQHEMKAGKKSPTITDVLRRVDDLILDNRQKGRVGFSTDRIEAEKALKENELKYRELANTLPQIVFETDAHGMITFANRNAFKILGYTEKDFANGVRHRIRKKSYAKKYNNTKYKYVNSFSS